MSTSRVLLLGAIAGLTIFVGLPAGRARSLGPGLRAFLNASAIGILVFLLYDVLAKGIEPVTSALTKAHAGTGSWWRFGGLAVLFAGCLGVGALALVYYDKWAVARARRRDLTPTVPRRPFGPGAAAVEELSSPAVGLNAAHRLALCIALGIGLHNFSEGLAIGQSAATGQIRLALLLIIGFGLHNATEGFGIVAPFAAEAERPSWRFLLTMGLIGGGPTFFGTVVGQAFVNDALFLACLALAAGSILYVIVQLLHVAAKLGYKEVLMWGLIAGLIAGFGTDMILTVAGV
jgi:ZIP family zinc transporter